MIDRSYICDLCRQHKDAHRIIGIELNGQNIKESGVETSDHHLCFYCLSSLQKLPARCGGGFECAGGPRCGSDHK